ncbi:MAG: DUF5915 domain-containing protein, partial [Candidatus Hodarchaeales archaeon]
KTKPSRLISEQEQNVLRQKNNNIELLLYTGLTKELRQEGYARETIRRIQQLRKTMDLAIDDLIHVTFHTKDKELKESIERFKKLIMTETLTEDLIEAHCLKEFQFSINNKSLYLNIN